MHTPTVRQRLSNYKRTELRADLSSLTTGDRQALVKLADAADLLTSVFYHQAWSGAPALRQRLRDQDPTSDELRLFELLRGPWDRSRHNESFIKGVGEKPKGVNVYPEDMTEDEFSHWVASLSEEDAKRARGFYHVVRRDGSSGKLELVPYAQEYAQYLEPAAALLQEAAELASDPSFAKFLSLRSQSLLSNKYLDSEVAWLRISHDSPLEAAIGPYETYEDEMFSAKAFFEALIHVRDFESTKELDRFTSCLQMVEDHLPIPNEYKNTKLVPPPITVVNQVYAGGDTAAPLVAAFNLPNDEQAIKLAGSKLTLIKNVQEAKFTSVLLPIAHKVLGEEDLEHVTFPAFFNHVLYHEVCHSAGPHSVLGSKGDTVRKHLRDLHSAFEEAKADIAGLFAAKLVIDKGLVKDITLRQFYTTYLASAFRSVRFGLGEAHGLGQAMQFSYLLEHGGFVFDEHLGVFSVDMEIIPGVVEQLTREIMLIQGDGDYKRAVKFRGRFGVLPQCVDEALKRLEDVPVDIEPVWKDIEQLRAHLQ
ncbi:hypothetical protein LPJ73_000037 [Coemansia sp. RSA 2703]|nr:hypothetical protein LPJ73_000037 [Coemansia sp. RSA 2703]KAJ2379523.1 hypothetical protein IW150_000103 [Coemansia sp. RSA 2607]KAJ2398511.1 hypothetical protein GGI05_000037 [Coemansia sp. RSA 2603]